MTATITKALCALLALTYVKAAAHGDGPKVELVKQGDYIVVFAGQKEKEVMRFSVHNFVLADKLQYKHKSKYGSVTFTKQGGIEAVGSVIDDFGEIERDWLAQGRIFTTANDTIGFALGFHPVPYQNEVLMTVTLSDTSYNNIRLRVFYMDEPGNAEQIWGLGEQYSHINFRGKQPFVFTEEQGIGRGDEPVTKKAKMFGVQGGEFTSYAPLNCFFTNRCRGFYLGDVPYARYNFTGDSFFEMEARVNFLTLKIPYEEDIKSMVSHMARHNGLMPQLPDWAYGTWLGLQGGAEKVKKITDAQLHTGNPVTAVWIQDWVGRRKTRLGSQLWWRWQADSTLYPGVKQFCAEMNAKGVKVLGYVNPWVANKGWMYEQAKSAGYLVKNETGKDYKIKTGGFPAYLVDLTNPAAFSWLKNLIKQNMINQGLSGWMADYGEALPLDASLYSGVSAFNYHNTYAVDWARLNREAVEEAGKLGEVVFFTRSAGWNSTAYSTLFWAGDQMVDFGANDGLPSAVTALITSGLSGMALNHTDIGGYTTLDNAFIKVKRSEELLKRWIEFAAFTPVFRTHEGLKPESNVQVYGNDSIADFFARFGKLHYALSPYLQNAGKEAALSGLPFVRALFVHYPNDSATYNVKDEFMLGDALLVAPVISKVATSRSVYLPKGEWQHAFTGKVYSGPLTIQCDAPIGTPPVFIQKENVNAPLLKQAFGLK